MWSLRQSFLRKEAVDYMWFIQNFIHTNFEKGKSRELVSNSIIKKSLKGSFRINLLQIFVAAKFLQFCKSFFRTAFLQIVRFVLPDYFLQIDWMVFFSKLCKLSLKAIFVFENCCFRQLFFSRQFIVPLQFFLVVGVVRVSDWPGWSEWSLSPLNESKSWKTIFACIVLLCWIESCMYDIDFTFSLIQKSQCMLSLISTLQGYLMSQCQA